jgi:uncharacterized membrane protein
MESTSIDVGTKLLSTGILTIPLILAATKYAISDFEPEGGISLGFGVVGMMVVLGYATLLAVIVSAGTFLSEQVNSEIESTIYLLMAFASFVGTGVTMILRDEAPERWMNWTLAVFSACFFLAGLAFIVFFMLASPVVL